MNFHNLIVFDLEWNSGCDETTLQEILQIGAVKLDLLKGPIQDTFRAFVKPEVHDDFDCGAQALDISPEDLADGAPFPLVLTRFLDWCGKDCQFAAWGSQDLQVLRQNTDFFQCKDTLPSFFFDLQAAASAVVGAQNRVALHNMSAYFQFPDSLDFHDARNDSFYAAMVGRDVAVMGHLDVIRVCRGTDNRPAPYSCPLSNLQPYVCAAGRRFGGFSSMRSVLLGRGVRRQFCPQCESPLSINCWFPLGAHAFLARSACPTHGQQYFWATLSRDANRRWRGKIHTLQTSPVIEVLYSGRDKSNVVHCLPPPHRKRKT